MTGSSALVSAGPASRPAFAENLDRKLTALVIRPARLTMERLIRRFDPLGSATFFDPATFPWSSELESSWRGIRSELDLVLRGGSSIPRFCDLSPMQAQIIEGTGWRPFFLYATGQPVEENCRRCPETTSLLGKIPGLENAFFSVLEPHTHLKPHRGPYAGVLRYHLGLRVPGENGACRIRVGSDVECWREGSSLVFDDSHDHEAWNETSERRVVLFVDFRRPLPAFLSLANRLMLRLMARAAFAKEIKRNLSLLCTANTKRSSSTADESIVDERGSRKLESKSAWKYAAVPLGRYGGSSGPQFRAGEFLSIEAHGPDATMSEEHAWGQEGGSHEEVRANVCMREEKVNQ